MFWYTILKHIYVFLNKTLVWIFKYWIIYYLQYLFLQYHPPTYFLPHVERYLDPFFRVLGNLNLLLCLSSTSNHDLKGINISRTKNVKILLNTTSLSTFENYNAKFSYLYLPQPLFSIRIKSGSSCPHPFPTNAQYRRYRR